jgi:hypothetical protein
MYPKLLRYNQLLDQTQQNNRNMPHPFTVGIVRRGSRVTASADNTRGWVSGWVPELPSRMPFESELQGRMADTCGSGGDGGAEV